MSCLFLRLRSDPDARVDRTGRQWRPVSVPAREEATAVLSAGRDVAAHGTRRRGGQRADSVGGRRVGYAFHIFSRSSVRNQLNQMFTFNYFFGTGLLTRLLRFIEEMKIQSHYFHRYIVLRHTDTTETTEKEKISKRSVYTQR